MASPQGVFYEALGRLIARARRAANVTQAELARAIGLSRSSVANIEKGRQPVQVYLLLEISRGVGRPFAELLPPWPQVAEGKLDQRLLNSLGPRKRKWVETVTAETVTEDTNDG